LPVPSLCSLLARDIQHIDHLIHGFGGILLCDVGEVRVDGGRFGAAMTKQSLNMTQA